MPGAILVIGRDGARGAVLAALREEGHEPVLLDSVEAIRGRGLPRAMIAAIVLVGEEAAAGPDRTLSCLAEIGVHAPVVLVRSSLEAWEVRAALVSGAMGIVLAEQIFTALHPCLLAVSAGQVCIPRRNLLHAEPPVLSSREKQVLGLVVMGYMNGEIASRLFLAESTVKSHLSSAFTKLGVRSRHEAVDLILDPQRGLSTGILTIGAEPVQGSAAKR